MKTRFHRISLRVLLASISVSLPAVADEPLQFNKDIRPILSENCFACHGFDAETREADVRLDEAEWAFKPDKHGFRPIVPGNLAESLVWERITTEHESDVMPPPKSHKKLTAAEKAIIARWIEEGAPWQEHWAFEAPVKPGVPEGEGSEIDRFISAMLQSEGKSVSPEADRPTLIRRASMALRGLPASIEELDEFLADPAPDAYERLVGRLLDSPQYGEEMARHWLDVARYADTHGLHLDNERQTWAYRDWVVRAFNTNLPYDDFIIDQLAGDLRPDATTDQIVATGFNRCNVTTGEGGSINEEYVFRYAVDRASTTAQAFLGLTAGCAVCHDHKYDPITAKDFYSLYAFFHSNADPAMDRNALLTPPVLKLKTPGYDEKMQDFADREAVIRQAIHDKTAAVEYEDPANLEPKPPVKEIENVWFDDAFPEGAQLNASGHPTTFVDAPVFNGELSLKRGGDAMAQDYYNSGAKPLDLPQDPRFFIHVYLDPENPPAEVMIQFHTDGWKHRALWGEDIIEFGTKGTTERYVAGDLPPTGEWVKLEVNGSDLGLAAGMQVTGFAFTVHGGTVYFDQMGVTGRVDPTTDPGLSFAAWRNAQVGKDTPGVTGDLQEWLKEGPDQERSPEELKLLRDLYLQQFCSSTREHFAELQEDMKIVVKERDDFDATVPSTFIFNDLDKPRESFVMIRGEYDNPGEKVEPNTPAILPPLQKEGDRATRLDLAKWMVAEKHPLTARVAVNRFWQQMFGAGLVRSSHDFGTQGDLPSHPELLDWLSVWFQENGWDVKKLMRLMVTSATFRQQSAAPEDHWQDDPHNRLLARGPRFRLDAEQLRDQALFVGGLISLEMGGKGVNPYQPPNIWEPVGFGGSNTRFYKQDTGDALYRRTLYTFFKRTAPHPLLSNFDAPNREQSCIQRERSNTPLQALQLMNDVQHYEAARGLAQRMIASASTPDDRVAFAFRAVLARLPEAEESAVVLELYQQQLAKYQTTPAAAEMAIEFGQSKPPEGADAAELAAWALVANLILNMDEAVVRN